MRALALFLALCAAPSFATEPGSIDGLGRVTIGGGYRIVPNDWFRKGVAEAGFPVESWWPGGPQGFASFGYGVHDVLEVSIDLVGAGERFTLTGRPAYTSVTYGALLGGRVMKADLFFEGFTPFAGVLVGPIFGYVGRDDGAIEERVTTGFSAVGGIAFRISNLIGLWLEYRFLLARAVAPEMDSGINVGGSWFGLGLTIYFDTKGSDTMGTETLRVPTF